MEQRQLGKTGLSVSVLGQGGAAFGQQFGPVSAQEAGDTVRAAIDAVRSVEMTGTELASNASGELELGKADHHGNWPMVLHVKNLKRLPEGGYYDLYLTKKGKPVVLCGTFNVDGETAVRFTAAYDLEHFDKNGWVVTRQPAGHFKPDQIVLRPEA